MKLVITAVVLILTNMPTSAQSSSKHSIYNHGERLTYTLSYNASVWPRTDMGNVVFSVEESSYKGMPSYIITAKASTNNFFSIFFKLKDTFRTQVDKRTMRPLEHDCQKEEGSYRFGSKITFDWDTKTASSWYKNYRRNNDTNKTLRLTDGSMDPIGYFYKIRSEDFSLWPEGEERTIDIVLEDTVQKIKYRFLKRENISTPKYDNIPSLKFACQLSRSVNDDEKSREDFYIWLSDDKNKVPILVEAPTKIGKIKARLTDYSGLKYEDNCLLK